MGWCPALHWSACRGSLGVAQVLFRYGATLDVKDVDGLTPTDVAVRHGHGAFSDALRTEELRRRDHGFKRDRCTIVGTEEHAASTRPWAERVDEEAADAEWVELSDDDDDDDGDEEDD